MEKYINSYLHDCWVRNSTNKNRFCSFFALLTVLSQAGKYCKASEILCLQFEFDHPSLGIKYPTFLQKLTSLPLLIA